MPVAIGACVVLLASGCAAAAEAPAAPASPASATRPAEPAQAFTVTDFVLRISSGERLHRDAMRRAEAAAQRRESDQRMTALEAEFDSLGMSAVAVAEFSELMQLERRLWLLRDDVSGIVDELTSIARDFERDGQALRFEADEWQERLRRAEAQQVPAPLIERAQSIAVKLRRSGLEVSRQRDDVLLALQRAVALRDSIDSARALVDVQVDRVRTRRTRISETSLWHLAETARWGPVFEELRASGRLLSEYLVRQGGRLAIAFFGIFALTWWLFTSKHVRESGPLQRAYGRPIAAALLIALVALARVAPDPPVVFYAVLLTLAPIPAAMVVQRAFAAPIPLTLYGLALMTALLPVRNAIDASAYAGRVLMLVQILCLAVPLAIDLRMGRLYRALPRWNATVVRVGALVVIVVAALTALNVVLGVTGMAATLRVIIVSLLGYGLVFGATAVAGYGALLALLAHPMSQWIRSARESDPALLRAARIVLALLAGAAVALVTVGGFGLLPNVLAAVETALSTTLDVGTVSISSQGIAMAAGVVLATLLVAAVVSFILDREVMPRLRLRPGAGYAIVTLTRWSILVIGTVLSLAALGIDPVKITVIAGALGVGIGFGLQNIVNNFVSGLILIVERPVGVGDLIEIGPLFGEVKRIGIRSSTVRTVQGAEVIVPNAELVAKEVINWTRSDRQRRYDIDVGVAYGSDPEQVLRLLQEAAGEVPEVMKAPPPFAMFRGFGDSSLDFRLLAWVHTIDVGLRAQSALRLAILRKFNEAGVVIPFPQRDLHIRSSIEGK